MQQIFSSQKEFFLSQATKDVSFRKAQLKKLYKVLRANEDKLISAIHSDFHKSEFETIATELELIYHEIRMALKYINSWSSKKSARTNLLNFPAKSYTIPEPLGVALVIGAWNYPYQLSISPCVSAIAAGCTVMLKPSELPGATSRVMAELISENFNPEYFAVIEGGVDVSTQLLELPFDKIFFTGSTRVGKIVYQAAAKNLTPVTLELGGKSPAFVMADCKMKMTTKRLVWSKFLNSGQTCIAPDYVLVENKVKDKFLSALNNAIDKQQYSLENGNFTQIINDRNFERLSGLIDREKVCYGGDTDAKKRWIGPTVMKDVSFEDKVMEDEIFGPILPVIGFDDLDKTIAQVQRMDRPLSAYVFTSSSRTKKKILRNLSFGGGGVNEAVMHLTNPNLPFGGVGGSGIGAYHGKTGFDAFTHYKAILEKTPFFELNLKYYPHSRFKLKWIRRFFKF